MPPPTESAHPGTVSAPPPTPPSAGTSTPQGGEPQGGAQSQTQSQTQSPAQSPAQRMAQLQAWLSALPGHALAVETLRPASADASFRRYFRIDVRQPASQGAAPPATRIVMDAPPELIPVQPFLEVGQLMAGCGISVPQVFAQDVAQGFLLLSDFGDATYLAHLNPDNAHSLYMDAIGTLLRLQAASQPGRLPPYDSAVLLRELRLFPEWYIGRHLGLELTEKQAKELEQVFALIAANNLAQQRVYVHRDFHSRNLMLLPQDVAGAARGPGVLDFQDALYGPVTYDLVSLLRDAYIQWDEEQVLDWAIRYWERARKAGVPVPDGIDDFYRDFEFMGLQRHLKILGIFARLKHRDGKDAYLRDLPPVLAYVRKTAGRYSEFKPLLRLLDALENKAPQVGYTF